MNPNPQLGICGFAEREGGSGFSKGVAPGWVNHVPMDGSKAVNMWAAQIGISELKKKNQKDKQLGEGGAGGWAWG